MWNILELFGKNQTKEYLEKGAKIIDVRSQVEFAAGHCEGSINIPLDRIKHKIKEVKKLNAPLVLCCASGMRSGQATTILKGQDIDCCNGGGWNSVANKQQEITAS